MNSSSMLVLVPPLLVLIIARVIHNVAASLLFGILTAGLIACDFSPIDTFTLVITRIVEQTALPDLIYQTGEYDKLFMLGFLSFLGVLIEFMAHSGNLAFYTKALLRRIRDARGAQFTSLALSACCFIDDYLSSLMVGSIMRPITDFFKVPRAKLAYLINTMSGPLCVLIPATSWAVMTFTQLQTTGISTAPSATLAKIDPFAFYINAIPFLFYPILSVFSAWFIVYRHIGYGTLGKQEAIAQETGNLFGGKETLAVREHETPETHGSMLDIILTLASFVCVAFAVLIITGGWHLVGGEHDLLTALMKGKSNMALFIAVSSAVFLNGLLVMIKHKTSLHTLALLAWRGFMLLKNSLLVLVLSWALSILLQNDLHTGSYIAGLLLGSVPFALLPAIVFLTSTIVSASTGSSWGTIMFLIPLALPLAATFTGATPISGDNLMLITPILGALLSGAVAGSHLSPITDATVVASASAGAYHLDYVRAQVAYSLPALIIATLCFIGAGLIGQTSVSYLASGMGIIGMLLCAIVLSMHNKHTHTH